MPNTPNKINQDEYLCQQNYYISETKEINGNTKGYYKLKSKFLKEFANSNTEVVSLFGVFDGHGPEGHLVSKFIKSNSRNIYSFLANLNLENGLKAAIENVDSLLTNTEIDYN